MTINPLEAYSWECAGKLSNEDREQILKTAVMRQKIQRICLLMLYLLFLSPFVMILWNEISQQNELRPFSIAWFSVLAGIGICIAAALYTAGSKTVKKLQAGVFVWRYGTVKATYPGSRHRTGRTIVDEQSIPFVFGAAVGDLIVVVSFDTSNAFAFTSYCGYKI